MAARKQRVKGFVIVRRTGKRDQHFPEDIRVEFGRSVRLDRTTFFVCKEDIPRRKAREILALRNETDPANGPYRFVPAELTFFSDSLGDTDRPATAPSTGEDDTPPE